jgi:glutamyl-tRNA synthetase
LINFIARIGWSYDDRTELFTREELIEKFSLDGLNASPARFDYDRLDWMNGVYIRELETDDLARRLLPFYREAGLDADLCTVQKVAPIIQVRLKKLPDAVPLSGFIFRDSVDVDLALLVGKKMDVPSSLDALKKARTLIAQVDPFIPETLEQALRSLSVDLGVKAGSLFGILRGAITGQRVSPPLFETTSILGRERTFQQIDKGIAVLQGAEST